MRSTCSRCSPDYPRVHLTRLGSLYTNGRSRFSITYPNDPTALALPLDNGRSIRGEDISTSVFQSYPVPGLIGLAVQPRSLSLFRAEQMLSLSGAIHLEGEAGKKRLINDSELELRDAILIELAGPGQRKERFLGKIGSGATVEIDGPASQEPPARVESGPGPDPNPILGTASDRPGNRATRTPARSAWSPGCRARSAGKRSTRQSTAGEGSPRSSFI